MGFLTWDRIRGKPHIYRRDGYWDVLNAWYDGDGHTFRAMAWVQKKNKDEMRDRLRARYKGLDECRSTRTRRG